MTVEFSLANQADADRAARSLFGSTDKPARLALAKAAKAKGLLLPLNFLGETIEAREDLATFTPGSVPLTDRGAVLMAATPEGRDALARKGLKPSYDAAIQESDRIMADRLLMKTPEGRAKLKARGVDVNAIEAAEERRRQG